MIALRSCGRIAPACALRNLSHTIQSMTGYAAASADSPRGRLTLELRSVNARFLDVQFRIAEELRALEPALREQIGARLSRGKIDCRFFLGETPSNGKPQRLNPEALARLRSEEHTSELQSLRHLVCRLLLEKKK